MSFFDDDKDSVASMVRGTFSGLGGVESKLFDSYNKDPNSLTNQIYGEESLLNARNVQPSFAEDLAKSFNGKLARPRRLGRTEVFGKRFNRGNIFKPAKKSNQYEQEDDDEF